MTLILSSFILSLSVFLRMIGPVIVIGIASSIIWSVLNIPTAGYASYLSEPITATFVGLYGIRTALELKGDLRRPDFRILILKSVLYGVFFFVVMGVLIWLANAVAVLFAMWQVGEPLSADAFTGASQSTQGAVALLAVGSKTIIVIVALAVANTVMAVPLASAAREASYRAASMGFFYGIGRSFLPLFCIFFVSFFLQIYLELFTFLFALVPVILSIFSIILAQSLPEFDPSTILMGIAALAGLLWLNSWVWSASALALIGFDGGHTTRQSPTPTESAVSTSDIRALRKSRE